MPTTWPGAGRSSRRPTTSSPRPSPWARTPGSTPRPRPAPGPIAPRGPPGSTSAAPCATPTPRRTGEPAHGVPAGHGSLGDHDAVQLVPLGRDLPQGQPRAVDLGDRERKILRNMFDCKLLPGGGVVLLLRVVQVLAAGPGHDVEHALGGRVGLAFEHPVEGPPAADLPALGGRVVGLLPRPRPGPVLRVRDEGHRIAALIIMHVSAEDDVDLAGLE